jgi:hypothetical protein
VKLLRMWYAPSAEVEFTWTEVECMILFSEQHYDYKCKELSRQGGVLYGMRNMFDAKLPLRTGGADDLAVRRVATITYRLDATTADLLAKTVEQDPAMLYKLMPVVKKLNAEWNKINAKNVRETRNAND